MSRIFWDTNLFIYLFEGYGNLSKLTIELRKRMLSRGDQLLTSALTLGEILVKPAENKDSILFAKYQNAIAATAQIIPFDVKAAPNYAKLRCDKAIRAPDAIQLACAGSVGVELFITNDARLHGKQVDGIQFIVPLDRTPI